MLWEDFVLFYFDVTPKRINQLLETAICGKRLVGRTGYRPRWLSHGV
jgi:hypothetical protein